MHIPQQIIWRKKLEEYNKILIYTYFEKQYDQMFPLDVYFFFPNEIMRVKVTHATTKEAFHI